MNGRTWLRRPATRAVAWVATIATLVAVLVVLGRRTRAVVDVGLPAWWAVLGAVAVYLVANLLLVHGWRSLVAFTGPELAFRRAGWIWSASQFSRYLFSLAQVPGRAALAARHQVPLGPTLLAGVLELGLLLVPVSTVVLLTAPWWLEGDSVVRWLSAVAVLPVLTTAVVIATPAATWRAIQRTADTRLSRRLGREGVQTLLESAPPSRGRVLHVVMLYVANHALRLGAFLTVFVGTAGAVELERILQAIAAAAVGTLAGIVAFFAPGGLGVREATAALGLTPIIGAGPAFAVTVAIRFLELLAEVTGLAIFAVLRRDRSGRDAASSGDPA